MALCPPSKRISNGLILEAKAAFITCRYCPLECFVAHVGQPGREGGRFSPTFQLNTFVLQIRIYTQTYNFFFFFFVATVNQVTR